MYIRQEFKSSLFLLLLLTHGRCQEFSCASKQSQVDVRALLGPNLAHDIYEKTFGACAISNHLTGVLTFQSIMALGWLIGGTIYQGILTLDLSEDVRGMVQHLGFLFAPENLAVNLGRNLRNAFFGFSGRILFDFGTDPSGTLLEFSSIRLEEIKNRMMNLDWLKLWLGRFLFQTLCLTLGIAILYYFSTKYY